MRYAVVRDNVVENVVEWDGESEWAAPEGATLFPDEAIEASPGDTYDGKVFTRPAPAPDAPASPTIDDIIAVLPADMKAALDVRLSGKRP